MSLKDIPVRIDLSGDGDPAGMAQALLREIADHLRTVAAGGERQIVGLATLPLSDADRTFLKETLGRGEVEARISAAGTSEVYETAYPGVWWVTYMTEGGQSVAEQLEIGTVPMILEAHLDDIRHSAERFPQLFEDRQRNHQ
jgi:hydrogenase-1 operon protein HyaF